jgi:CheY-like chemotaxis protein
MLVIEDDDLSRELLGLLAIEAGFGVESAASGEEALSALLNAPVPAAILADMQMPGICGPALAQQLRRICGAGTTLLAMSGSKVVPEKLDGYDGFLLKPFSADELKAACDRRSGQAAADENPGQTILNEEVFERFERGMPAGQVFGLYTLCLNDSGLRLEAMRQALHDGDDGAYRRAAHAIKGGCGMVGATELAQLASEMESAGLPREHDETPLVRFLAASARLERMLNNKAHGM